MGIILKLAGTLLPGIFKIVDKAVPDKDMAAKIKLQVQEMMYKGDMAELKAAASIISAEASGDSWLQRNWRPMTMINFLVLVNMYWFGYTPENITPEMLDHLFMLIKIGLGGYIVGRSSEKVMKMYTASKN